MPKAFLAAILLLIRSICFILRSERAFKAFSVQLRLAYTLPLIICFFPPIRGLFWLPAVGTFALVVVGYGLTNAKNAFDPVVEPHRNDYGRPALNPRIVNFMQRCAKQSGIAATDYC